MSPIYIIHVGGSGLVKNEIIYKAEKRERNKFIHNVLLSCGSCKSFISIGRLHLHAKSMMGNFVALLSNFVCFLVLFVCNQCFTEMSQLILNLIYSFYSKVDVAFLKNNVLISKQI